MPSLASLLMHFNLTQELHGLRKKDSWRRGIGRSSKTLAKYSDVTAFGVVVKIEQVLIHCPSEFFQPSQSPANANNSPSLTSKQ